MDWIQFPFEVNARVHRGAGAPTVRLRWVYTDLPFLPLGTQCQLMNRVWDEDQVSDLEVGQLPPEEADYVQDARWTLGPGALGGHICHPEWLQVGEPWPNDLPAQEYTAQNVPVCCCVPSYEVVGAREPVTLVNATPASRCRVWSATGPIFGEPWAAAAPNVQAPGTPWQIRNNTGFLSSFWVWHCLTPWNGRGVSPPFTILINGPPPTTTPVIYLREVV